VAEAGPVHSIAFAPNGQLLAAVSDDGTTRIWNVDTGDLLATFISLTEHGWAMLLPDGSFVEWTPFFHIRLLLSGTNVATASLEDFPHRTTSEREWIIVRQKGVVKHHMRAIGTGTSGRKS
jgi:WD40 repeat protein